MSNKREGGIELLGSVLGDENGAELREHIDSQDFGKECATWAAEFAYGTVWSRDELALPLLSCAVMGMLIALRQTDELKYPVRIALSNGLTVKQIEEVLYLSVPYAGFPAANSAKQAIKEVLREREIEAASEAASQ